MLANKNSLNMKIFASWIIIISSILSVRCSTDKQPGAASAQKQLLQSTNAKPWSYWWWMGNAVDTANIDYNLKKYAEAGIGGLHIVPIYGVKGYESQFIQYLSPEWIDMLAYTAKKCKELGLGLDMTLGTGWCFGGPGVDEKTGSMFGYIEKRKIGGGPVRLDLKVSHEKYPFSHVESVLAVLPGGKRTDITKQVNEQETLIWDAPGDSVTLFIQRIHGPVFKVKRAAPGGEGFMLDPFSVEAMEYYLQHFDSAFDGNTGKYVRAIYHDSYEYRADWSYGVFDEFEKRRGYDLRLFLPELYGGRGDTALRVIADYRRTMAEMHREYIRRVTQWAESHGVLFRNQGHGSPANWLDIYAEASIPETEAFGASVFNIPGLTRKKEYINKDHPNRFVMKFASSAAHVAGRPLVSSESNTWLREHFQVALSHSKPELDKLMLAGVNHIFYHGITYSPKEAPWPGWLFYASTNFGPTNSIFHHFHAQNKYVDRCQKTLREGSPGNDILLYFPIQDIWHAADSPKPETDGKNQRNFMKILYKLSVHNAKDWLYPTPFYRTARALDSLGYAFDYVSDDQLFEASVIDKTLKTPGGKYKALVVPRCDYMPLKTMRAVKAMADHGFPVIFIDKMPDKAPGYHEFEKREHELAELTASMKNVDIFQDDGSEGIEKALAVAEVKKEDFPAYGIPFIRRKRDDGYTYFISNLYRGTALDDTVMLAVEAKDVIITDPVTGISCKALFAVGRGVTSMKLQISPGQALIIRTYDIPQNSHEKWAYFHEAGSPIAIMGKWKVEFIEGRPALPEPYETDSLTSWAAREDPEAQRFAGTARYTVHFNMENIEADDYLLKLTGVHESALVRLNGHEFPVLFAHPYQMRVGRRIKKGDNVLEIEATNLSANCIRDLDKRKVSWKNYYNINFVNINYKPFDASAWPLTPSGLTGEVRLIPLKITNNNY